MGYLFCALALLAGVTKGYCGKKTSGAIRSLPATMLFNAVRMAICVPIGLLFMLMNTGSLNALAVDGTTLLISAVSGVATSVFVVSWIAAVRVGAYMMVDVFLTLGVAVPIVACRVFFGEAVRWNHAAGLLLLTGAAYIMCGYNRSLGKASLGRTLPLLILCGAANGLVSFSQKWFGYVSAADVSAFNFYIYVFSTAALALSWAATPGRREQAERLDARALRRLGVYVTLMSLCLFLHSLFSTMAARFLSSSQLYPLMQGGALILSMLMSALCFGEKITGRCVAGICVAFAALLCINLL